MRQSAPVNLVLCSSSSQHSYSRPSKSPTRSQSLRCIPRTPGIVDSHLPITADPAHRENLPRIPSCIPDGPVRKRSLKLALSS